MNRNFDVSKPVQTRSGKPARIVATDYKVGNGYTILAIVEEGDREYAFSYLPDGRFSSAGREEDLDLVNVPQRIKKSMWLNIYRRNQISAGAHDSREQANRDAAFDRVACVEVLIDCEEGQGL
jgi:hypothetical protein